MIKRLLTGLATLIFLIGVVGMANAIDVTVTYTADNIVNSWYYEDSNGAITLLKLGANNGNWEQADSYTINNLNPGKSYSIIWNVSNLSFDGTTVVPPAQNNPAAFLAQIDLGSSTIDSSTSWQLSDDGGGTWVNASSYGDNGTNIWESVAGGPVAGISPSAQWIWSGAGGDAYNQQSTDANLLVKESFTTDPPPDPPVATPEPTTFLLFGAGLAGVVLYNRKKIKAKVY